MKIINIYIYKETMCQSTQDYTTCVKRHNQNKKNRENNSHSQQKPSQLTKLIKGTTPISPYNFIHKNMFVRKELFKA